MQKNVPSEVVYCYCAWYVFLRDRRYIKFSQRSRGHQNLLNWVSNVERLKLETGMNGLEQSDQTLLARQFHE